MARFNPTAPNAAVILGGASVMNTIEAAQRKREEEERRLARAEKFGLNTAETQE